MKMILQDAIYRKVFTLSSVAVQATSTGELVNIMSTDTSEVVDFTCTILVLFAIPVTVFLCLLIHILVGGMFNTRCTRIGNLGRHRYTNVRTFSCNSVSIYQEIAIFEE